MTREEAVEVLRKDLDGNKRYMSLSFIKENTFATKMQEEINEAIEVGIEALEQMDKVRHFESEVKPKMDLEKLKDCFDKIGIEYGFDNGGKDDFACLCQCETINNVQRIIKFYYFNLDGSYIKEEE